MAAMNCASDEDVEEVNVLDYLVNPHAVFNMV